MNIELINFELNDEQGNLGVSTCGFVLSEKHGKPFIDLFEVKENEGPYVVDNIFKAAPAIQHLLLPDHNATQIDWQITNGHYRSRVFFEEAFGHVYKATFKDGFVRSAKFFARPLERYIKAMDDPEGFESNMTSGHGFGTGDSQSFIAVPVPLHPNGEIYFKRNDTHRDEYGYEVVLVKPNEFVRDWATKELSHSRYDEYVFISDADQAAHYMHSTSINDHSPDMAYLGYCESLGISFTNGRHRTANSAILGAPYLAVDVCILGDPEQREIFKAKYEWQGDSNPYQGLTPEELDAMGPKYRPPSPSFDVPLQDEFVGDDASKSSFSFDPRKFLRKLIP